MEPQVTPTQSSSFFSTHKVLIIFGIIILFVLFWLGGTYNSLVTQKEGVDSAWAQVDNQLQRRFDLIPNLTATVKGLSLQEQKVFGDIADARTRYAGAATTNDKALAANQFESALGRLLVITENYPNLQSSAAFRDMMVSLEGTENRIAVERQKYNQTVQAYNTDIKMFPRSLLASMFGFGPAEYFQISDEARTAPKVDFVN